MDGEFAEAGVRESGEQLCERVIDQRGGGFAMGGSHLPAPPFTMSGEVDILKAKACPAFCVEGCSWPPLVAECPSARFCGSIERGSGRDRFLGGELCPAHGCRLHARLLEQPEVLDGEFWQFAAGSKRPEREPDRLREAFPGRAPELARVTVDRLLARGREISERGGERQPVGRPGHRGSMTATHLRERLAPTMEERSRRQAENELLFRKINEEIEQVATRGPLAVGQETGESAVDFVCECQDKGCTERLALTIREYEAIREHGDRFVVAPAPEHVDTRIEHVVDMSSRYWVVEKIDEAGDLAEEKDPRN